MMASTSSLSSHGTTGESVCEDEAARPLNERLQEIQHGISPAVQPSSMVHSVAGWLFGYIAYSCGVLGSLAACLPHLHVKEHEEANEDSYGWNHEAVVNDESAALTADGTNIAGSEHVLESKHKVFLSHSSAQKDFVEQLCTDLQRWDRYPFFDKLRSSLPIGVKFPKLIFDAIDQCEVGVVVLSEEFFMSKWPMLELHAMVQNYKKPNSRITIIPVFYRISAKDLKNLKNQKRWISKWKEWGGKDKHIHVDEWIECIRTLGSINGLVMKEGMGNVRFREEIVKEVCGKVRCETRWDDSHVQGRLRICKVIEAKIGEVGTTTSKALVVGLYGVGGIGKTTLCKALCNELASKYGDLVCHIELGSKSELEMLQKALKKLTNIEHDIVDKLDDMGKGCAYLKKKLVTQPIFLALDNVQDTYKSLEVAQTYLKASYGPGSVVLVTSRSLDVLKKLNLKENQCLGMPELEEDEARSLFLDYTNILACDVYEIDDGLVKHCIRRCHFLKSDGKSRHYHPLALKVLGQQFGLDCSSWEAQLMKIDTFNQLEDVEHPVFCIFQNSFDSLNRELQLVFLDLALTLYDNDALFGVFTVLDILCIVHEERIEDMKDMLELLKRKSMLDEIRLGEVTRIGMHDLWREFAVAVTSKTQDLRDQQMVYQVDERRGALGRRDLCRENVERMYFRNWGWKGLDGLKLDEFVNVTGLRLDVTIFLKDNMLDLDLSGLKQLRALHVECPGLAIRGRGLSSLRNLRYLFWLAPGISLCFDEIGCLTKLLYLALYNCKGVEVLDLTKLKALRLVYLGMLPDLISVRGISSRMASLLYFCIRSCESFRECPGLGEVHSLEIILIDECGKLEELPCLGQLSNLKQLIITECKSLRGVPGLGDLVALEKFNASGCGNLITVPDVGKLTKLQQWSTLGCPVQGLPGLDGLISLTLLRSSFDGIVGEHPAFSTLSALTLVSILRCNWSNLWTSIQNLPMLVTLVLQYCRGDDVVPDLQNLKRLKHVVIISCDFTDLSGLSNLTALEGLHVNRCDRLEVLPAFERLTKLMELCIKGCNNLRDWPCTSNLCSLVFLSVDTPSMRQIVPVLGKSTSLRDLVLCGEGCESILSMAFLSQLETLHVEGSPTMQTLDLNNFPRLRLLELSNCSALEGVTCSTPLGALVEMDVRRCERLVELPDLNLCGELEEVTVRNCSALKGLTCSKPLTSLEDLTLIGCGSLLGESVDVGKFPKLARYRRVDSSGTYVDDHSFLVDEEERQNRRFPEYSLLSFLESNQRQ